MENYTIVQKNKNERNEYGGEKVFENEFEVRNYLEGGYIFITAGDTLEQVKEYVNSMNKWSDKKHVVTSIRLNK